MKLNSSVLCILSIGLSLAVFGNAAKAQKDQHHHHKDTQVDHSHHHKQQANHHHHVHPQDKHHKASHSKQKNHSQKKKNHHHHIAPAAIPHVAYHGKDDSKKHKEHEAAPPPGPAPVAAPPPAVAPVAAPHAPAPDTDQDLEGVEEEKRPKKDEPVAHVPFSSNKEKMVVAYWTDWTAASMPPEAIPFDKVTHINYAFAIVRPDFTPVFETDYLLNRVVKSAHARDVKVLMSIGGWTGSQYFSPLAATKQGRKTFIDGAIRMVRDYDLDGIDIDWEYPGRLGSACNAFDEQNDAKNFLTLLRELRSALSSLPKGERLQISLATRIVPFDGPNGQMTDVSEFSKVVNHINVMAYDINGSWGSVTGANAPLGGSSGLTYEGGAQAWIRAGFPPQQINMGVPFYGRSLVTKRDMTQARTMAAPFDKNVPIGDNNDGLWTDPCEKTAAYSGVWKFKNLREQGVVDEQGQAKAPWIRKFDEDSQTPWLFNPETKQFISYDDRESLRLKVEYAKRHDLGGVMLWAINQDTTDFELLSVLQEVRS